MISQMAMLKIISNMKVIKSHFSEVNKVSKSKEKWQL